MAPKMQLPRNNTGAILIWRNRMSGAIGQGRARLALPPGPPMLGVPGFSGWIRRSSFGYDDLLACARGELFGAGNAQLPLPPMLMFDRISEIAEAGGEYGKGLVRAVLELKPDLWFFPCHFKGDPVMPGCLGLDAL